MSLELEGLRHLMRGSDSLPVNLSETEIKHYSSEVMRRLRRGETVEALDFYLRGIDTSSNHRLRISAGTHDLAQKAHVLFNTTADRPLRG
jgi:hypothetical protein